MPDVAAAASAVSALKTAADLAKTLIDLGGTAKARAQAIELHGQIIASQTAQLTLIQIKRDLEAKVADLEAKVRQQDDWNREKDRYVLTRLSEGYESFAFTLKTNAHGAEIDHALCPHCFDDHKKRVLSGEGPNIGVERLSCSDCGFVVLVARPMPKMPWAIQL